MGANRRTRVILKAALLVAGFASGAGCLAWQQIDDNAKALANGEGGKSCPHYCCDMAANPELGVYGGVWNGRRCTYYPSGFAMGSCINRCQRKLEEYTRGKGAQPDRPDY